VEVVRNDGLRIGDVATKSPAAVVISPGPGTPRDAGISIALVEWCAATKTPLLGVCLGHQAIGAAYGARIVRAPRMMHGKMSLVHHTGEGVVAGLPSPFEAGRYHSLAVEREGLDSQLRVTAWTDDGVVMGVKHSSLPIEGVQFHPESILTPKGMSVLRAFLANAETASAP
jgi:anthranilate synthase component 2